MNKMNLNGVCGLAGSDGGGIVLIKDKFKEMK